MSSGSKINRDTSLKIATWNIRSLRRKDKLVNVIREMKRYQESVFSDLVKPTGRKMVTLIVKEYV